MAAQTRWNAYHDSLLQLAIAMMTEPGWQTSSEIQRMLFGEGGTMEAPTAGSIMGQLSEAAGGLGQVPKVALNEATNKYEIVKDQQGNIVYQNSDELMGNILAEFQNASQEAKEKTEARYKQIIGQPGEVLSLPELAGRMETQYYGPLSRKYSDLLTSQRTTDEAVRGAYATLASEQAARDAAVADQWSKGWQNLNENPMWTGIRGAYQGLADQAREDIRASFDRARASANQDLINRGLYNTTVGPSLERGLTEAESQEMRRLDEQLAQQQLGTYSQMLANQMAERRQRAANQLQLGLAGTDWERQLAANQMQLGLAGAGWEAQRAAAMQGLYQAPYPYIASRSDIAMDPSQIANLAMQFGQASEQQFPLVPAQAYSGFSSSLNALGS